MKQVITVILFFIVAGCHWHKTDHTFKSSSGELITPIMDKQAPGIDTVLLYRIERCQLSPKQLANEIAKFKGKSSASSQLEIFILASCNPEYYATLLKLQTKKLKNQSSWPQSYDALFDLIHTQIELNERNVSRQQKEIDKLNKTIEALTKIEQELDSRDR